mgnify:CR=1 FL=1
MRCLGTRDQGELINAPAGHYKALEWVEDAKDWRINHDMGIQVTVEVGFILAKVYVRV